MKYQVGTKVIIRSKTYGESYEQSNVIKRMKKYNIPFAYVIEYVAHGTPYYICNEKGTYHGSGDFFAEKDLLPFVVTIEELEKELLNGQITLEQFKECKKYAQ